ncbi:MAG: (2Fe-2S)-binding protein [Planctomycetes bacterium]|nr:(2Fe-2S)-binding protein [Planctomycetota bacterium]
MGRLIIKPGVFEGEVSQAKTILQVLLELHAPMHFSCRRGLCGQDLIRVLAGWENLNPIGDLEDGTLELLRAKGKQMRMACCTRVVGAGEVIVEVVK